MKIFRYIFTVIFIIISILGVTVFKSKIQRDVTIKEDNNYSCILNLYHIDTFAGGTGSRQQFLLKTAYGFEKSHQGVFINVINVTPTGYVDKLSKGVLPDMVSYGVGIEVKNQVCFSSKKDFPSGNINGKLYSLPWARGGYYIFDKNPNNNGTLPTFFDKMIVSYTDYTSPFTALKLSNVKVNDVKILKDKEAYTEFLFSDNAVLLGTQRDLYRLQNSTTSFSVYPLKEYNDLFQYISVTSTDKLKTELAIKFIDYLVSDDIQAKLTSIRMFSPYIFNLYSNDFYALAEKTLPSYTPYASIGKGYQSFKDFSKEIFLNPSIDEFKIKNSLISLDKFYIL